VKGYLKVGRLVKKLDGLGGLAVTAVALLCETLRAGFVNPLLTRAVFNSRAKVLSVYPKRPYPEEYDLWSLISSPMNEVRLAVLLAPAEAVKGL
jgi:hypothetical protein